MRPGSPGLTSKRDTRDDETIPGFTSFTPGYNSSAARWHATRTSPNGSSAGTSVRHRSIAYGQRVWKAQPEGGFRGEGSSPLSTMRWRRARASSVGVLASYAFV